MFSTNGVSHLSNTLLLADILRRCQWTRSLTSQCILKDMQPVMPLPALHREVNPAKCVLRSFNPPLQQRTRDSQDRVC